jgi:4-amino-4-deoxy-L-arabinose transferase-like glycosyltransferase
MLVLGAGAWYLAAFLAGGEDFVAVQLRRENVDRFVGSGIFTTNRRRTLLKLPIAFALSLLPWNLALLDGARRWWRGESPDAAARFLNVWWLTILLVFSFAAGKRAVYLLPLYPAVAILAGTALARVSMPARAVAVLVLLIDLVAFGVTQARRVGQARAQSLVAFARAVATTVPPDAHVHATPDLDENEYLTLGWLLDRPFERATLRCPSDEWWIAPPAARRHPVDVAVQATARHGRPIALVRCGAG